MVWRVPQDTYITRVKERKPIPTHDRVPMSILEGQDKDTDFMVAVWPDGFVYTVREVTVKEWRAQQAAASKTKKGVGLNHTVWSVPHHENG